MELKFETKHHHSFRGVVLIVPLWNWNEGWEDMGNGQEGFNRTFMELKYGLELVEIAEGVVLIVPLWNWNVDGRFNLPSIRAVLIVPLWNWNQAERNIVNWLKEVLIVPLWNWNSGGVTNHKLQLGFNRTFMELK